MAYSVARVYAYCDSGFSMINTPATPAVLESASSSVVDLGDINCLSLIGKKSGVIRVKDFNGLPTCDYLRIVWSNNPINTYWLVNSYEYVSGDTVSLAITLDGFLTCGGTAGITDLSGYVVRHTVADDTYGKYTQSDEMIAPSQNLIFRSIDKFGLNDANEDYYNIVLSTINLLYLGSLDAEDMGLTYGDMNIGEAVTVPQIPQIPDTWKTTIKFGNYEYVIPGAFCFDLDGTGTLGSNTAYPIREGIARARSLGVEGGIIAMYALPKSKFYCDINHESITIGGITATLDALVKEIRPATGATLSHPTSVHFNYANVNNKRALYGDYAKVQVVSMASGEKAEYDLVDLYSPTAQNTQVVIKEVGDGRAHGKPYFYPEYYMDAQQDVDNLLSCIAGMEWQNVPIVYQYSSGEGMQRNRYFTATKIDAQQMLARQNADKYFGLVGAATGNFGSAVGMQQQYNSGWKFDKDSGAMYNTVDPDMLAMNFALKAVNSMNSYQSMLVSQELSAQEWVRARMMEKKDLMVNTRVVAPEIAFAPSESTRDFIGNGCLVGFITMSDNDLQRADKLLTMYGYKESGVALTTADLTAGLNFSYIEATGVQVKTSVPVDKTIKEMCEAQISNGIRIWKARPDFSKYTASNR